uniref:FLYWCH-type domain-containing protein n=1 Tax=Caenorhabditis tropicalis TaxID=1561998 RepID=A0A1I7TLK3_9PELO
MNNTLNNNDSAQPDHEEPIVDVETVSEEKPTETSSLELEPANASFDLNNTSVQSLLSSLGSNFDANTLISKMFGATQRRGSLLMSPIGLPKKTRLKVFANGFFMTFDKVSSCKTKHFWRCEFKNTCKARMHTDIHNKEIESFIHDHNHKKPTDEEVSLYGLDPTTIQRNHVYVVNHISDPTQRRKIRKQVAEQEAAAKRLEEHNQVEIQKQQTAATMAVVQSAYAQMVKTNLQSTSSLTQPSASPRPMLLAQLPFLKSEIASPQRLDYDFKPSTSKIHEIVENPIAQIPRHSETKAMSDDLLNHPTFQSNFEIAQKLRKIWKRKPRITPKCSETPTEYLEFYVSNKNESEDQLYVIVRIEQRNEEMFKDALEKFIVQKCLGRVVIGISSTINVVISETILKTWENGQFFLLDVSNPNCWQLKYVDELEM